MKLKPNDFMTFKLIVCLTGFSGTGKTTLARLLRSKYGFPSFKIGNYLENIAKEKNQNPMEFIQKIKREKGQVGIIETVLPQMRGVLKSKKGLIVEGINTFEEIETIKKAFPGSKTLLFVMKSPFDVRVKRVIKRKGFNEKSAREYVNKREQDRVKNGLDKIDKHADGIIINKDLTKKQLLQEFGIQIRRASVKDFISVLESRKRSVLKTQKPRTRIRRIIK